MNQSDHNREQLAPGVRTVTLLVAVRGLSGKVYPPGTEVYVQEHGFQIEGSIDGFLHGDWIPLRWFEYSTGVTEPG
jgi:hypothetical protein